MHETDESKLSDAARTALSALRRLSLTELHAIRVHFLGVIQRERGREAFALAERTARREFATGLRVAAVPLDEVVTLTGLEPPAVIDMTVMPDDVDEDGDEVLEPTPLEAIDPINPHQGPWPESSGPVS
jgi:hypothetical protein